MIDVLAASLSVAKTLRNEGANVFIVLVMRFRSGDEQEASVQQNIGEPTSGDIHALCRRPSDVGGGLSRQI